MTEGEGPRADLQEEMLKNIENIPVPIHLLQVILSVALSIMHFQQLNQMHVCAV